MKPSLLVIDDDQAHREGLTLLLEDEGYQVAEADSAVRALELMEKKDFDLIITDYKMQKMDGMELLKLINDRDPLQKVIMVTGYSSIEHAVQAVHLGALDYIPKPVDPVKLKEVVRRALQVDRGNELPHSTPERYLHFGEIIGKSRAIRLVVKKIQEIANIDVPVMIYGESGTGKELVARALHSHSVRARQPFVAVNTGSIPKDLISSDLFGHEKGAFTGAVEMKRGKFEEADQGTLFLDEISSMDEKVQIALLRVLENHEIERVGSNRKIAVNVRTVTATNIRPEQLIEDKRLREDLFYRLNVYSIDIPPLRDRVEDIMLIADAFRQKFNTDYRLEVTGFDEETREVLETYSWPGNIRELRNVVLRAQITAKGDVRKKDLPENLYRGFAPGQEIRFPAGTPLPQIERESIIKTLRMARGNKMKAAEMLGISRRSLYNKIEDYTIRDEEFS